MPTHSNLMMTQSHMRNNTADVQQSKKVVAKKPQLIKKNAQEYTQPISFQPGNGRPKEESAQTKKRGKQNISAPVPKLNANFSKIHHIKEMPAEMDDSASGRNFLEQKGLLSDFAKQLQLVKKSFSSVGSDEAAVNSKIQLLVSELLGNPNLLESTAKLS